MNFSVEKVRISIESDGDKKHDFSVKMSYPVVIEHTTMSLTVFVFGDRAFWSMFLLVLHHIATGQIVFDYRCVKIFQRFRERKKIVKLVTGTIGETIVNRFGVYFFGFCPMILLFETLIANKNQKYWNYNKNKPTGNKITYLATYAVAFLDIFARLRDFDRLGGRGDTRATISADPWRVRRIRRTEKIQRPQAHRCFLSHFGR